MRFLGFRHHPVDESDLSAFMDEALSEAKRVRVEAHLRSCDDCARKLQELKQLVSDLHALPEAKAPRSFALSPELDAVSQREEKIASEGRRTNARRAYLGLSGATAAAALLLVAAFGMDLFVVSNGGQPTSLPAATSPGGPLSLPQAAAALPSTTIPGYYANQPEAENQNSGQAVVPPVPPAGTSTTGSGKVIVPPVTPSGGQTGGGSVGSGQIAPPPPPLPMGTPGQNVEPPLNVPNAAGTAVAPPEKDALLPANQPTAAATPNALSAALPTVSPPGVATPAASLGETSALGSQARPAEKSASHAWLWALEGVAGGLFIGFGISALWMRRRWIRINRDS